MTLSSFVQDSLPHYSDEGATDDITDIFLLHKACAHHDGSQKSFQLIRFFAEKFPTAVSTPDADSGKLPLHHLFLSGLYRSCLSSKECATFETIQYIVDLYPAAILYNDFTGTTPLVVAITQAYSEKVMDYLASKMPSPEEAKEATTLDIGAVTLNSPRCQSLVRVLSKVDTLICRPSEWTWDGLICVLDHLLAPNKKSSVEKVVLDWIPRTFFAANQRIANTLKEVLTSDNNCCLKEIQLQIKNSWYDKNRQADQQCLESLQDVFHHHSSHRKEVKFSISLHAFQLYRTSVEDFVLRSNDRLNGLSLNCSTIFDETTPAVAAPADSATAAAQPTTDATTASTSPTNDEVIDKDIVAWKQCPVERIELVHNRMTESTFEGLLKRVSVLPELRHLKIAFKESDNFGEDLDLTSFVAHMLGQESPEKQQQQQTTTATATTNGEAKRRKITKKASTPRIPLQTLTIEGLYVDSTLLEEYAHACSCFVQYIRFGTPLMDLQHRTALTHFGVKECHDVRRASKVSLVENSLKALLHFEEVDCMNFKTGIAFSLLQGCPSVWALDS